MLPYFFTPKMTAASDVLFAFTREQAEKCMMEVVKNLHDTALKNSIYMLMVNHAPHLLQKLLDPDMEQNEESDTNEIVKATELRKASKANILRLMNEENMSWSDAWIRLRSCELEDGATYCEENDGDFAIGELVEAGKRGAEKRAARREAASQPAAASADPVIATASAEPVIATATAEPAIAPPNSYVRPPRIRDADYYWPYMRCKNVARALLPYRYDDYKHKPLPRSHHALLEFIANKANVSVEMLKKTDPRNLFRNDVKIEAVLGYSF